MAIVLSAPFSTMAFTPIAVEFDPPALESLVAPNEPFDASALVWKYLAPSVFIFCTVCAMVKRSVVA